MLDRTSLGIEYLISEKESIVYKWITCDDPKIHVIQSDPNRSV